MRTFKTVSVALLALLTSAPAMALKATQKVVSERTVTQADGTEQIIQVESAKIKPGDHLVYILNIENDGTESASNFVVTMPVPEEVKYLEGTAENSGAAVTYSADGGISFTPRNQLLVTDEYGQPVPAGTDDISHIRWKITTPLNAGETSDLLYKGRLR